VHRMTATARAAHAHIFHHWYELHLKSDGPEGIALRFLMLSACKRVGKVWITYLTMSRSWVFQYFCGDGMVVASCEARE
jgi:hypothetical protein